MESDNPSIACLKPGSLNGFLVDAPRDSQPPSVPRPFLDAMDIRLEVFVREQKVPAENEFDSDDPRSCHWIVYATSKETGATAVPNGVGTRQSSIRKPPVGTVRLVPFPHEPHPKPGGSYWNGVLEGERPASDGVATTAKPPLTDPSPSVRDDQEPYVKIGRLAVVKARRGQGLAGLLVNTALSWLQANPSYFDGAIKEPGPEHGAPATSEAPKWNGLIYAHAQEQAAGAWAKWGFQVDESMGRWFEEGIPHVGMFQRLIVERLP